MRRPMLMNAGLQELANAVRQVLLAVTGRALGAVDGLALDLYASRWQ